MHNHGSAPAQGGTPEQKAALLNYMVSHNKSHAEELHELAHSLDGEVAELIHEAVELFDQGNEKLAHALEHLKGEGE